MAKTSMIVKCNREPKFSTRKYSRCQRCGRPHSVYRKFGICRVCFRELALKGELPGIKKATGKSLPARADERLVRSHGRTCCPGLFAKGEEGPQHVFIKNEGESA